MKPRIKCRGAVPPMFQMAESYALAEALGSLVAKHEFDQEKRIEKELEALSIHLKHWWDDWKPKLEIAASRGASPYRSFTLPESLLAVHTPSKHQIFMALPEELRSGFPPGRISIEFVNGASVMIGFNFTKQTQAALKRMREEEETSEAQKKPNAKVKTKVKRDVKKAVV